MSPRLSSVQTHEFRGGGARAPPSLPPPLRMPYAHPSAHAPLRTIPPFGPFPVPINRRLSPRVTDRCCRSPHQMLHNTDLFSSVSILIFLIYLCHYLFTSPKVLPIAFPQPNHLPFSPSGPSYPGFQCTDPIQALWGDQTSMWILISP